MSKAGLATEPLSPRLAHLLRPRQQIHHAGLQNQRARDVKTRRAIQPDHPSLINTNLKDFQEGNPLTDAVNIVLAPNPSANSFCHHQRNFYPT